MFDSLSFIIFFFLLGFILFILWLGILFSSNSNYNEELDKQLREDSREDLEADLAMATDDEDSWMFSPESEDDEV